MRWNKNGGIEWNREREAKRKEALEKGIKKCRMVDRGTEDVHSIDLILNYSIVW